MSRFAQKVRVIANPYHQLDHKGRPCGVVPVEPTQFGGSLGYVGAKIDRKRTAILREPKPGDIRGGRQDTVFEFSDEPVTVTKSAYYADALKSGALLPADAKCATWAGLKRFIEPKEALKQAKRYAEAQFEREYGEGSLVELGRRTEEEQKKLQTLAEQDAEKEAKRKAEAEAKAKEEAEAKRKADEEAAKKAAADAEKNKGGKGNAGKGNS